MTAVAERSSSRRPRTSTIRKKVEFPSVAGAVPRPVRENHGIMDPGDVKAALQTGDGFRRQFGRGSSASRTPSTAAGGTVLPLEAMTAIHAIGSERGRPGPPRRRAAVQRRGPFSMFRSCEICKRAGLRELCALQGSGFARWAPSWRVEDEFMIKARRAAKMLGGGMRQAGLIAAPAIIALEGPPSGPQGRDHELARRLAQGSRFAIDDSLGRPPDWVQTNIVNCFVDRDASDASAINAALRTRGIFGEQQAHKDPFCHPLSPR